MTTQAMSIYFNEMVYELKQRGEKIVTLSLGEAFFKLDKPDFDRYEVDDLVHYTSSRGHPELIKTLVKYYGQVHAADIEQDNLMVTSGSKIGVYMSVLTSIRKGRQKVAILEPAWLSYKEQVDLCHGVAIHFPINTSLASVANELDDDYAAVIINNPNNPQGLTYAQPELELLLNKAKIHNINVIVDEAYSEFVTSSSAFLSAARLVGDYENLIVVSSLSKNMGMSGFRIGYSVACSSLTDDLIKLNQHLITCAPTILQVYIADKFFDILNQTRDQISSLLNLRVAVQAFCAENNISVMSGDSTFYLMIGINTEGMSIFEFCTRLLLLDNISVVPGEAYGDSCAEYVRVSVGTESYNVIVSALKVIKDRMMNGWDEQCTIEALLLEQDLPCFA